MHAVTRRVKVMPLYVRCRFAAKPAACAQIAGNHQLYSTYPAQLCLCLSHQLPVLLYALLPMHTLLETCKCRVSRVRGPHLGTELRNDGSCTDALSANPQVSVWREDGNSSVIASHTIRFVMLHVELAARYERQVGDG
jgi:hypothetical protein